MTFYVSTMPTFRELAIKADSIDSNSGFDYAPIDIVDMHTGEVYAIRYDGNLWEFCNYVIKDDRYYKLEKMYNRGLITYTQFLKLVPQKGV